MTCYLRPHEWSDGRWLDECWRCGLTWPRRHRSLRPYVGRARVMPRAIGAGLLVGLGFYHLLFADNGAAQLLGLAFAGIGLALLRQASRLDKAHQDRREVISPKSLR